MILQRRRLHIGEDILLARHGNSICRMAFDRRNNTMVAYLDDGTADRASNVISSAGASVAVESGAVLTREDAKFISIASGIWLAASLALAGGVMAMYERLGGAAIFEAYGQTTLL